MKRIVIITTVILIVASCNASKGSGDTDTQKIGIDQKTDDHYDPEAKLEELNMLLPKPPEPVANFVGSVRTGNLVFLSGQGPLRFDGTLIQGVVGDDLTIEEGYEAARVAGLNLLSALRAEIGNLNKVKRIVKVLGMVNATADFKEHPTVINGCSDLMVEIFGEKGKHARAAVGMGSLPGNIAVEIEMIVEVSE